MRIPPLIPFLVIALAIRFVRALSLPPLSASFLDNDGASLSNKLSSPERYAMMLNMSIDEIARRKDTHEEAMADLHQRLASDEIHGREKHALLCQHRLKHGRHPFVCDQCWSYLPICICSIAGDERLPLPTNLSVVVWTHHREWGLTSNTGGLLGLLLENCRILMKGLPEHDQIMDLYLHDPEVLVVVLWPRQQQKTPHTTNHLEKASRYIPLSHAKDRLSHQKVVLVAIDGTWGNARRMVARLPPDRILYTDLSLDRLKLSVFGDPVEEEKTRPAGSGGRSRSLLAPLRGRGLNSGENLVCTAEAVTGALLELGVPQTHANQILHAAKGKVDLVTRYRAKVAR